MICLSRLRHVWGCHVGDTWSTVGALLDGIPRTNTCLDHNFPPVDPAKQADQSQDWVPVFFPLLSLFHLCFPGD